MRWPLRNQILVRMLLLLLLTVAAITFASIRSGVVANRDRESGRIADIAEVLSRTRFPLSGAVLENMKSLSGAEFVLVDASGTATESTSAAPATLPPVDQNPDERGKPGKRIVANGVSYYHAIVRT